MHHRCKIFSQTDRTSFTNTDQK